MGVQVLSSVPTITKEGRMDDRERGEKKGKKGKKDEGSKRGRERKAN